MADVTVDDVSPCEDRQRLGGRSGRVTSPPMRLPPPTQMRMRSPQARATRRLTGDEAGKQKSAANERQTPASACRLRACWLPQAHGTRHLYPNRRASLSMSSGSPLSSLVDPVMCSAAGNHDHDPRPRSEVLLSSVSMANWRSMAKRKVRAAA